MSRAIEKDIAASLKKGDPVEAYRQISEVLNSTTGSCEIEILGKAHPLPPGTYLLQDGPAAAISKVALVQAFVVAHKILRDHLDGQRAVPNEELLAATSVALLLDPEHLTAANIRKKVVLARLSQTHEAQATEPNGLQVMDSERWFVDNLLMSRLHRHTKSPTLWSHRRWLMHKKSSLGQNVDVLGDITRVVLVAAERHPRNYYAWTHARSLVRFISDKPKILARDGPSLLTVVKSWCIKHHNDVSGWSFLHHLLILEGNAGRQGAVITIYCEILDLVKSFRWANESVWTFMRTLVASGAVGEDGTEAFFEVATGLKNAVPQSSQDWKTLDAAETWCRQYRRMSET